MTKEEKQKKKEMKDEEKNLLEENQQLKNQIAGMRYSIQLQDLQFYRHQKLLLLERQTMAMERLANNSEIPLEEKSKDDEEEDDDDEDDED